MRQSSTSPTVHRRRRRGTAGTTGRSAAVLERLVAVVVSDVVLGSWSWSRDHFWAVLVLKKPVSLTSLGGGGQWRGRPDITTGRTTVAARLRRFLQTVVRLFADRSTESLLTSRWWSRQIASCMRRGHPVGTCLPTIKSA